MGCWLTIYIKQIKKHLRLDELFQIHNFTKKSKSVTVYKLYQK